MTLPIITIVHNLPDRVRIHFSVPPGNFRTLREELLQDGRIKQISYSPISQTSVIKYDHKEIELLHILKKIAIKLADEYKRQPIYVQSKEVYRVSTLTRLSAIAILLAGTAHFLPVKAQLKNTAGIVAVVLTAASVIEHAYIEIKQTGSFDPETLSVVYLINSARKAEYVQGSFFTWLASFSRHLLHLPQIGGLKMSIIEGFDEIHEKRYLDVVTTGNLPLSCLESVKE